MTPAALPHSEPRVGSIYRVVGYHTGDFVGSCVAITRTTVVLRITDTLRPGPRVLNRCAFPQCVREDLHPGDHEYARVRRGAEITIPLGLARLVDQERQAAA
jgi:hypothetical protein